jgi:hypothetical protein
VVIGSAVIPTLIANAAFVPQHLLAVESVSAAAGADGDPAPQRLMPPVAIPVETKRRASQEVDRA